MDEKFKHIQKIKLPKYQNKTQEHFKEIPLDEQIKKMLYIHIMEYYVANEHV